MWICCHFFQKKKVEVHDNLGDAMSEKELNELYNCVESLEKRIERMDFRIVLYDAVKEACHSRMLQVKESREKTMWLLHVSDYLHNLEKSAIVAKYQKSIYEKDLNTAKSKIDRILGGIK